MKKFMLRFAFAITMALTFALNACNNSDPAPVDPVTVPPTVTAPSTVPNTIANTEVEVTFIVTIPGGYKSSELSNVTGGEAVVKTELVTGATTGNIVVTYTSGTTAGIASITLKVTDNKETTGTATAFVNVQIAGAPSVTTPVVVTQAIINSTTDVSFAVTAANGFKSAAISNLIGGTAVIKSAPAANATTGNIVVTYTGTTLGAGSLTLTVTDNNDLGGFATAIFNVINKPVVPITEPITENTTFTADNKYLIKGNIYVVAPAELTIEPGTVIYGDKATKGALIVSRGAKIHAVGTASKPIIFTSSSAAGSRNYGDWGGVVLLGKAANNQSANQTIEGISAASGDNGLYGGTTDDDNSGELQYARIEFAGIALSTDNELNGLTFGSVGSATKVDHIQVSFSGDDSYEWFGGTVNTTHLIAYRGWDDEFDTDFGYRGFNQFLVSFRDPNIADKSGSNGFESDNDAQGDDKTPQTAATFANVTFFGPQMFAKLKAGALDAGSISANYKRGAHIRRNSALKVYNSVFAGANTDGIFFDQTSGSAVVKGNYIARITGSAKPAPIDNTIGTIYDHSNFATDNIVASTLNAVDLTTVFAGSLSNVWTLTSPTALLAADSPLLSSDKAVDLSAISFPEGFGFDTSVDYIGAFDATNNWASETWTNYDPNNTEY